MRHYTPRPFCPPRRTGREARPKVVTDSSAGDTGQGALRSTDVKAASKESRMAGAAKGAAALLAGVLVVGGASSLGWALVTQRHAPEPSPAAAGTVNGGPPSATPATSLPPAPATAHPATAHPAPAHPAPASPSVGPVLARSLPVSITIPAIGVHSALQYLGVNADGSMQAPPLGYGPATNEAAWYKYSPTPGQLGASVIEGHVDSAYQGPSVFFRLGLLRPGEHISVTLADHTVAVFGIDGVRQYPKSAFPTNLLYGAPGFAALRLVTCSGSFDFATRQYLSNTVVFARLVSSHPET